MSGKYKTKALTYRNAIGKLRRNIKSSGKIPSNTIQIFTTLTNNVNKDRISFKANASNYSVNLNSPNFMKISSMDAYLSLVRQLKKKKENAQASGSIDPQERANIRGLENRMKLYISEQELARTREKMTRAKLKNNSKIQTILIQLQGLQQGLPPSETGNVQRLQAQLAQQAAQLTAALANPAQSEANKNRIKKLENELQKSKKHADNVLKEVQQRNVDKAKLEANLKKAALALKQAGNLSTEEKAKLEDYITKARLAFKQAGNKSLAEKANVQANIKAAEKEVYEIFGKKNKAITNLKAKIQKAKARAKANGKISAEEKAKIRNLEKKLNNSKVLSNAMSIANKQVIEKQKAELNQARVNAEKAKRNANEAIKKLQNKDQITQSELASAKNQLNASTREYQNVAIELENLRETANKQGRATKNLENQLANAKANVTKSKENAAKTIHNMEQKLKNERKTTLSTRRNQVKAKLSMFKKFYKKNANMMANMITHHGNAIKNLTNKTISESNHGQLNKFEPSLNSQIKRLQNLEKTELTNLKNSKAKNNAKIIKYKQNLSALLTNNIRKNLKNNALSKLEKRIDRVHNITEFESVKAKIEGALNKQTKKNKNAKNLTKALNNVAQAKINLASGKVTANELASAKNELQKEKNTMETALKNEVAEQKNEAIKARNKFNKLKKSSNATNEELASARKKATEQLEEYKKAKKNLQDKVTAANNREKNTAKKNESARKQLISKIKSIKRDPPMGTGAMVYKIIRDTPGLATNNSKQVNSTAAFNTKLDKLNTNALRKLRNQLNPNLINKAKKAANTLASLQKDKNGLQNQLESKINEVKKSRQVTNNQQRKIFELTTDLTKKNIEMNSQIEKFTNLSKGQKVFEETINIMAKKALENTKQSQKFQNELANLKSLSPVLTKAATIMAKGDAGNSKKILKSFGNIASLAMNTENSAFMFKLNPSLWKTNNKSRINQKISQLNANRNIPALKSKFHSINNLNKAPNLNALEKAVNDQLKLKQNRDRAANIKNLKKVNKPKYNTQQVKKNIQSKINKLSSSIAGRKNASNVRTTISNSNLSSANKEKLLNNVNIKLGF